MKRQGGFTLIEMVVVIVILGILAVTAAPRFLNLQDDARNSALMGLKGAISGAGAITYGKAAIEGQDGPTGSISSAGGTVSLVYGYPEATSAALNLVVEGLSDVSEWQAFSPVSGADTTIRFTFANQKTNVDNFDCYVEHKESTAITAAVVSVPGDACKQRLIALFGVLLADAISGGAFWQ